MRTWLSAQSLKRSLPGGIALQKLYDDFRSELPLLLEKARLEEAEITFVDWSHLIEEWFAAVSTVRY